MSLFCLLGLVTVLMAGAVTPVAAEGGEPVPTIPIVPPYFPPPVGTPVAVAVAPDPFAGTQGSYQALACTREVLYENLTDSTVQVLSAAPGQMVQLPKADHGDWIRLQSGSSEVKVQVWGGRFAMELSHYSGKVAEAWCSLEDLVTPSVTINPMPTPQPRQRLLTPHLQFRWGDHRPK